MASHVARLRTALAGVDPSTPPAVEHISGGYRVMVAPELVDVTRFEQVLDEVTTVPAAEAVAALSEALSWWRSPTPFADLQDTAYPAAEATRLLELRGTAIEALLAAHLDAGDPAAASAQAEARLHDDPYRERLWELLVLALYRQGRQGDALDAFRRGAAILREGLGIDPGPALRDLHARVLAQDPALLAPVAPVATQRRPCPYKGLARYDTGDAGLFVGREHLVDEVLARLADGSLAVVAGPSGAGKSSLVRAGLVPALADGALPGSAAWSVLVVVPGDEPMRVLDQASPGHKARQTRITPIVRSDGALGARRSGRVRGLASRRFERWPRSAAMLPSCWT